MKISWIRKGIKDFFIVVGISFGFIFCAAFFIKLLATVGIGAEYASTIMSLCLVFVASLSFSYLEYKNSVLESEKLKIMSKARKIKKEIKNQE